jgi:hypothetical protein
VAPLIFNKPGPRPSTNQDDIHRTDIVTDATIGAQFLIDHMNITFFADSVHRANIVASSTIDTIFGNVMSSHASTSFCGWFCLNDKLFNSIARPIEMSSPGRTFSKPVEFPAS